jgi:hypothetical protein
MSEALSRPREHIVETVVLGASASELIGGAGAVVLAIIGLAHYAPLATAAICPIALGIAFALNGGLLAGERKRIRGASHMSQMEAFQFTGGVSIEAICGVAAIVLGMISLIDVGASVLIPIAALVLGVGMMFDSAALARFNAAIVERADRPLMEGMVHGALALSIAAYILVGVGAIVLGILGLLGYSPLELSLIGFLALGSATLLSGAALTGRALSTSLA